MNKKLICRQININHRVFEDQGKSFEKIENKLKKIQDEFSFCKRLIHTKEENRLMNQLLYHFNALTRAMKDNEQLVKLLKENES